MEKYINTIPLFPELNNKLVSLLKSLDQEEFGKPTQFADWTVKDICAHLLDTSLRRLSSERDKYILHEKADIKTYNDIIKHVTWLADRWAMAFNNISPGILIEMIEKYQYELTEYLETLDPYGESVFPVSWAGEEKSENWFDIAREYTERWHHQMQIREALGKDPIYQHELYYPVLDTFMRALPYHFRDIKKEQGYVMCVTVSGEAGGKWYLEWKDKIELKKETQAEVQTDITVKQDDAWKIFTRWNDKSVYNTNVRGDGSLGEHLLKMNCLLIEA